MTDWEPEFTSEDLARDIVNVEFAQTVPENP